ncbi:MAG TPA: 50S ribosomal protein L21 [Gaiellaceae bacterium]|nr:50S ribosomal protein L21 [Gaiellaceae bacterium]
MSYAVISLGGKQYRVREGERLLVDRLPNDEGQTFTPRVLLTGGDGDPQLSPDGVTVTARVVGHVLGEKVRIGKYRPKSGYRRHTGYRSRLSQIEIESIATGKASRPAAKAEPAAAADEQPQAQDAAPVGYEGLKVAEVAAWAEGRHVDELRLALEYEQAHAARKGAVGALEAAIAKQEEGR